MNFEINGGAARLRPVGHFVAVVLMMSGCFNISGVLPLAGASTSDEGGTPGNETTGGNETGTGGCEPSCAEDDTSVPATETTAAPPSDTTGGPPIDTMTGDPTGGDSTTSDSTGGDGSSSGDPSRGDTGASLPQDVSGQFLLAIALSADPSLPLQYIATFDFMPGITGGMLDVELLPLTLEMGSTDFPREPYPPSLIFQDVPVALDGTFSLAIDPMFVAEATNPIIEFDAEGHAIEMDLQILDVDTLCGTLDGTALGVPLAGSTIGAMRVTDTSPQGLPLAFDIACP
ncbi:MAG: hypothetical protein K0V04_13760 [Deltaproteobacteria bacterium]|nr:hypothetical protein [Deltaproteobacteria bacterium]